MVLKIEKAPQNLRMGGVEYVHPLHKGFASFHFLWGDVPVRKSGCTNKKAQPGVSDVSTPECAIN